MGKLIDLTGMTFGRLRVVKRAGTYVSPGDEAKAATWICECECGNTTVVIGRNLRASATKSCGCMRRKHMSEAQKERWKK